MPPKAQQNYQPKRLERVTAPGGGFPVIDIVQGDILRYQIDAIVVVTDIQMLDDRQAPRSKRRRWHHLAGNGLNAANAARNVGLVNTRLSERVHGKQFLKGRILSSLPPKMLVACYERRC